MLARQNTSRKSLAMEEQRQNGNTQICKDESKDINLYEDIKLFFHKK